MRRAHDVLRPRIECGQPRAEPFGLRVGILARPRAKLHEQHALAFGQHLELVEPHPFRAKRIRNRVVEPLEADRLVGEDLRHVIGRDERIGKPDADQPPERRARRQAQRRFEHRHARALAADERARHVEAVFGQELVEVVPGHAARDARKLLADERREPVPDALEAGVDLPLAPAGADDRVELRVARLAHGHPGAVVQHHVELVDVVDGLAAHQRVNAARVVADHPAERAAAVRRRIGREREVVHFCGITDAIEDDARLHASDLRCGVERDDAVQVLREVHDHRDVAALAGEARARAARQDRRAGFAAGGDRRRRRRLRRAEPRARSESGDSSTSRWRRARASRRRTALRRARCASARARAIRLREKCRAHARGSLAGIQQAPRLRERAYFQTASMASKRVLPTLVMV